MANTLKKPGAAKGARSKSSKPEVETEEETGVAFDAEKFREHVKSVAALKSKAAETRGKIGAAVKSAEEDYGIHRGAAALWIKLDRMEPEALGAFLKAFDDMRTALGHATQAELFDSAPASAGASLSH